MRATLKILATCLLAAAGARLQAADPPPVKLSVKPLLCVVDKGSSGCMMTFDVRWKSQLAREYCLNDNQQLAPLRCWTSARAGDLKQQRLVSEAFIFWLGAPDGVEHIAEAKIEVLRIGSADRRRERRSRHVWDVL